MYFIDTGLTFIITGQATIIIQRVIKSVGALLLASVLYWIIEFIIT